jgi:hypothetical protein
MRSPQSSYHHVVESEMSGLCTAENLVVMTIRLAFLHWSHMGCTDPDWRGGLKTAGLPNWAIGAFAAFLHIVVNTKGKGLSVSSLNFPSLGLDELMFLQVVSLFQHYDSKNADIVLNYWLTSSGAQLANYPAVILACAMQKVDLMIPLRVDPTLVGQNLRTERPSVNDANRSWQ